MNLEGFCREIEPLNERKHSCSKEQAGTEAYREGKPS